MEESFKWIAKAINTSLSPFHLECCEILVELFATKYRPDLDAENFYNLLLQDLHLKRIYLSPDA